MRGPTSTITVSPPAELESRLNNIRAMIEHAIQVLPQRLPNEHPTLTQLRFALVDAYLAVERAAHDGAAGIDQTSKE